MGKIEGMEEMIEKIKTVVGKEKMMMIVGVMGSILLIGGGLWWWENRTPVKVEIISEDRNGKDPLVSSGQVWVDVQGAVEKAGVYQLEGEARVKDALLAAGGLSSSADRSFVARYVNLAQKVADGVKIYIPKEGEGGGQVAGTSISVGSQVIGGRVNINTSSQAQLERLTGIGESRAKAIIGGRPYGSIDELLSKKILTKAVFEKIKEEIW